MNINQSELSIAGECFAKYGYAKTSLKILSEAMGIATSTFYQHVKSKKDLFKLVLYDEIEQFKKLIESVIKKYANPIERICAYITTRTIGLQKSKNLILVLNNKQLSRKFLPLQITQKYINVETKYLEDILQAGVQKGYFMVEDLKMEASAIISAIGSLVKVLNQFQIIEKSEEKLYQILNILLYGVIKS